MTSFHAATVHPDRSVTYCGEVGADQVAAARAIARLDHTPRLAREHPNRPGVLFVLRDDGALDVYEPVGSAPHTPRIPDPAPRPAAAALAAAALAQPLGAASGTIWIPGAIRIGDGSIGGAMDTPGNPPRVTLHTTESPAGGGYLESMSSYLIEVASEPQLVYCPVTDRIAQLGPLHQSARALRNDGARRTNREGRVNIQIEVLGYARNPWTTGWDPGQKPGWRSILAAARSWGVPDAFPAGPPAPYPGPDKPRSRSVWQNKGGYFGHCDVPGNDHGDPGALDTAKVLGGPGGDTPPPPRPTVSVAHLAAAARADIPGPDGHTTHPDEVRVLEDALVAEDLLDARYADGSFGTRTRDAYAAWQRSEAGGSYSGPDADGIPGIASLTRLAARHGFTATD